MVIIWSIGSQLTLLEKFYSYMSQWTLLKDLHFDRIISMYNTIVKMGVPSVR